MLEFDEERRGLVRLIYASRLNRPAGIEVAEHVRAITVKSMHNNRLVDITGFLICGEGRFLQLLEGPAARVDQTFERIRGDDRHADIVVLDRGPAERRLFRDWNMGQHMLAPQDAALLAEVGQARFSPATLDAEAALHLLKAVGAGRLR